MADPPYDFNRAFRVVLSALGVLAFFFLIWYLRAVLFPFAIALVLAYLLNPIADKIQARTGRRWVAVLLTMILFGLICVGIAAYVIPTVITEVRDFSSTMQDLYEEDQERPEGERMLPEHYKEFLMEVAEEARKIDEATILGVAQKAIPKVWGWVTGAFSMILGFLTVMVIFLYVVFLLLDFHAFQSTWRSLIPPQYKDATIEFIKEFQDAMHRYFRGRLVVTLLNCVIFTIGFSIIGIRMAILMGILVGALNIIPYLQVVGFPPALLLGILKGIEDDGAGIIGMILAVCAVFVVAIVIEDTILIPRIIGDSTGLRPAVIMLSLAVWGQLLGFLGVVLAIPLTCMVFAYYRRLMLKWKQDQAASA